MPESAEELGSRLEAMTVPDYRARLLDTGLARGLIWRDGVLPQGAPAFRQRLTNDLLDYAYAVLAVALRLRSARRDAPSLERAFLVAGEAIEAAVHRGEPGRGDNGFHRVSAAVAFHLAGYAARAYSMLPSGADSENLAPTEMVLVQLFRRSLDEMNTLVMSWLLDDEHQDWRIAQRLRDDPDFDEADTIHLAITTSFMRGLALFGHALTTGEVRSAAEAQRQLRLTAEAASDLHAVNHWWTSQMASHLVDGLWQMSLHQQIPTMPQDDDSGARWNSLRQSYIQRLRTTSRSTIELWPSQVEAAHRAIDPEDDLVVALPTGAGKTRIAELCILRALASGRRVMYLTPLRALSAQVERDLSDTFLPLGFSVSALYGSAGIQSGDTDAIRDNEIVVATPEKLDFALRNDPMLLDDVGLIVLDEGHMLGPDERGVRYEALIQRLLRRSDASSRRIVSLSALFPSPQEMEDLVSWIRQDDPGTAIYSTWHPTRQRYGTIRWRTGAARLDITVGKQQPFVPRFVEEAAPPEGSRRRNLFPHERNELTLAAAQRFIAQGQRVLIYCALRTSVEVLGKLAMKCIKHGVLPRFAPMSTRIRNAIDTGTEWLGPSHPTVQCLEYGIALHHGGLPAPFRNDVEELLRSGDCPLTIASPTLAQGLNLSASVLLIPSIWRNGTIIPASELANVAGRAGRPFVDLEGVVLHVVWEAKKKREDLAMRLWNQLVTKAKEPAIRSGLLQLSTAIFERIRRATGVPPAEIIEHITGHWNVWEFDESLVDSSDETKDSGVIKEREVWDRDIASLDAAILALLDSEAEEADLDIALEGALDGSLYSRQMAHEGQSLQTLLRQFLLARTQVIWTQTSASQRRGYHLAGIGLKAGQFLDANTANLVTLLLQAEVAMDDGDSAAAADAIVGFAQIVFQMEPFRPPKTLPPNWERALRCWIEGQSVSQVAGIEVDDWAELLQDAISYRLPWAMEAARVHAVAVGQESSEFVQGRAAMAVELGSANGAVMTLLRAGLGSREAAIASIKATGASFADRAGMNAWLRSEQVESLTKIDSWPTPQSRHAWLQFTDRMKTGNRAFTHQIRVVRVKWSGGAPPVGTQVIVDPESRLILSPRLVRLGVLASAPGVSGQDIVGARVGDQTDTVVIECFGPQAD